MPVLSEQVRQHGEDETVASVTEDSVYELHSMGGLVEMMVGRAGDDYFVIGSETSNGVREIDIIRDFEAVSDTIPLKNGVRIDKVSSDTPCEGCSEWVPENEDLVLDLLRQGEGGIWIRSSSVKLRPLSA